MSPAHLRRRRLAMAMTQRELALAMGCSTITISRYERGATAIPHAVDLALQTLERARRPAWDGTERRGKEDGSQAS